MKKLILPALASLLLAGASATAQELPKAGFVREHVVALLHGILTPEQTAKFNLLAYQVAVGNVCHGFVVDQHKFIDAFQSLTLHKDEKASAEQKDYHDKHLAIVFGIMVGGDMAALGENLKEGCNHAMEIRNDPENAKDLVWK
ncbi:hypothetical protein ACFO1V_09815 [Daeguia caeni]|uniref:Uncharacterized protein n=1 Tax=Daeguia caeni TaxID=439612 RepID=A0ABV9H516_9HYPH